MENGGVTVTKLARAVMAKQKWKCKFNVEIFTPFYVNMIQICIFAADPSTQYWVSLAEQIADLRHPITLILFKWRVPALVGRLSLCFAVEIQILLSSLVYGHHDHFCY